MSSQNHSIRIMTYNIHKGIGGVDRRYDIDRVVEVIQHYHPDIALLQEVDDGAPRSKKHRQVDLLGERLELKYSAFQSNVKLKQGCYGNAILSRFPLDEPEDVELTVSIKKCRRALLARAHVTIDGHSRSLQLCNAHLGLAGFERNIQIRRILTSKAIEGLRKTTPVIVGGDFNDVWSSHGRKLMFPDGFQCAVKKTNTFPAVFPVRSLDAMYYRGKMSLIESFAGRTQLAKKASDHLPVIADFQFES